MHFADREWDTGCLTWLELEHTAAKRMTLDFSTEFREWRAPATLNCIHGDTGAKSDGVQGIGANTRSFIADEMRARATHDRKKSVRHLHIRHSIPRISIPAFVSEAGFLAGIFFEIGAHWGGQLARIPKIEKEHRLVRSKPLPNGCPVDRFIGKLFSLSHGGAQEFAGKFATLGFAWAQMEEVIRAGNVANVRRREITESANRVGCGQCLIKRQRGRRQQKRAQSFARRAPFRESDASRYFRRSIERHEAFERTQQNRVSARAIA